MKSTSFHGTIQPCLSGGKTNSAASTMHSANLAPVPLPTAPAAELKARHLVFSHDRMPGYARRRQGQGWCFLLPEGGVLTDLSERRRLLSLAIPPAYQQVWICMNPQGHLQATGIDDRGRKQYRYHPDWSALSADRKFTGLAEFARALPQLRRRVAAALASGGFEKDRIVAGIVGLLDQTGYRIGNRRYVIENRSYGLVSLLSRHLIQEDGQWILRFRGKSGQWHRAKVRSGRLSELIRDLHELPGQQLFRYESGPDEWSDIGTSDVNAWLKEAGGGEFTAKQFRTWRATVHCARALAALPPGGTAAERRSAELSAIRLTAAALNHTPATCRKYYIHPAIHRAFESGQLHKAMLSRPPKFPAGDPASLLRADERRVLRLIESNVRQPRKTRRVI